ncbi:MAG TPA: glycosyltransferase, partial [Saprospiraceae bacterium]|nr:glycosyltransferase [Saprospiraceae bacterium]
MTIFEGSSFALALIMMFLYLVLISKIYHGWDLTEEVFKPKILPNEKTAFTIIIACRNEASNLSACLESIFSLDYEKELMQIVVVDDHSTDGTANIAQSFEGVICVKLTEAFGKKAAMSAGVSVATNGHLWFVDADCVIHKDQANLIDTQIQKSDPDFIACPVIIEADKSILTRFQYLDNAAMMAITANGIYRNDYFLANGANMVIKKTSFMSVGGFSGNTKLASGDDVFLIKKMHDTGKKIAFLKSRRAAVVTPAENELMAFLNQRRRWATKTKSYANMELFKIQGFIFLVHLMIILCFL